MNARLVRLGLSVGLLFCLALPSYGLTTRIEPLQTRAAFDARDVKNRRSIPVRAVDGRVAYVLSLEPDFDVANHVVVVELVLRRAGSKTGPNLLEPRRRWHGLQPYMFAANDFVQGIEKSSFGQTRALRIDQLGLKVRITVTNAVVQPISSGGYQTEGLDLNIEVESL